MNKQTHKIQIIKINPDKFINDLDIEQDFPSLENAAKAAGILHEVIHDGYPDVRVGRDYNILIAEI